MNMNLDWPNSIEKDESYIRWLESNVFPEGFFEPKAFAASHSLYHVKLADSLLEDVVHVGVPSAGFTKSQLNEAIRLSAEECFGNSNAKWFHVNVHDNLAREIEKVGRYSFDYPLVPLYIMLNHHQALEGGTTYAGLASATRDWLLLFDSGLDISVHGNSQFVSSVLEKLENL